MNVIKVKKTIVRTKVSYDDGTSESVDITISPADLECAEITAERIIRENRANWPRQVETVEVTSIDYVEE